MLWGIITFLFSVFFFFNLSDHGDGGSFYAEIEMNISEAGKVLKKDRFAESLQIHWKIEEYLYALNSR